MKEEADLANDPIFSPDVLKREKRKQSERDQKNKGRKGGSPTADSFATTTVGPTVVSCPLCKGTITISRRVSISKQRIPTIAETSSPRKDSALVVSKQVICPGVAS